MNSRIPALFAFGVALLLLTNPVYLLSHASQSEYRHDIEPVSANEVPAEADVIRYATLSAQAKAAIRDAQTEDGIVYGEANKPPEFFYSDYASLNHGIYYVKQNGTYYRLRTYAYSGPSLDRFLQWALVVLGLGIGLIGYVSLLDRRRRLPTTIGAYGAAVLVAVVFQSGRGTGIGVDGGFLLVMTLVGIASALVTFGMTARRSHALWTAAAFAGLFLVVTADLVFAFPPLGGLLPGVPAYPITLIGLALLPGLVVVGYIVQLVNDWGNM